MQSERLHDNIYRRYAEAADAEVTAYGANKLSVNMG